MTKYSEKDIQKAIRYLKTKQPKKATREQAIKLLDKMQGFAESFVVTVDKLKKKTKQETN